MDGGAYVDSEVPREPCPAPESHFLKKTGMQSRGQRALPRERAPFLDQLLTMPLGTGELGARPNFVVCSQAIYFSSLGCFSLFCKVRRLDSKPLWVIRGYTHGLYRQFISQCPAWRAKEQL